MKSDWNPTKLSQTLGNVKLLLFHCWSHHTFWVWSELSSGLPPSRVCRSRMGCNTRECLRNLKGFGPFAGSRRIWKKSMKYPVPVKTGWSLHYLPPSFNGERWVNLIFQPTYFHVLVTSPGSHVLSPSKPPSKTCEVDQIPPKHLHNSKELCFLFGAQQGLRQRQISLRLLRQQPTTCARMNPPNPPPWFQDWWMMLAPAKFRYLVTLPSKDGWILQAFKHLDCILWGYHQTINIEGSIEQKLTRCFQSNL